MGDYYTKKDLEYKTIAELKEFAKEHGISTTGCYSKESLTITILSRRPRKPAGKPDFIEKLTGSLKQTEDKKPKLEDPSSLSMHRNKQKELEDETSKMEGAMNDFFKSIGIDTKKAEEKAPEHPRHVHYPGKPLGPLENAPSKPMREPALRGPASSWVMVGPSNAKPAAASPRHGLPIRGPPPKSGRSGLTVRGPKAKAPPEKPPRGLSSRKGLTNGSGLTNGMGLTNGFGLTNGTGLTNGFGLTNGSGLTNGFGLTNGNSMAYGPAIYKFISLKKATDGERHASTIRRQTRISLIRSKMRREAVVAALIILMLLIVPVIVYVVGINEGKFIKVDGRFGDWNGVNGFTDQAGDISDASLDLTQYRVSDLGSDISFYAMSRGEMFKGRFVQNYTEQSDLGPIPYQRIGSDVLWIFIDTDDDQSTGYYGYGLGSEHMLEIKGSGGRITSSTHYRFEPNGQSMDWSDWKVVSSVHSESVGNRMETQIWGSELDLKGNKEVKARFVLSSQEVSDVSDSVASVGGRGLLMHEQSLAPQVHPSSAFGTQTPFSKMAVQAVGKDVTVKNIGYDINGQRGRVSSVGLFEDTNLNGLLDSGDQALSAGASGSLSLGTGLIIKKGQVRELLLTAVFSNGPEGDVVGFRFNRSQIISDAPMTFDSDQPLGCRLVTTYLGSAPDDIRIDGAFGDWARVSPVIDIDDPVVFSGPGLWRENVDMSQYRINSTVSQLNVYLEVSGTMMGGTPVPANPFLDVLPIWQNADEDNDGVYDPIDPDPHSAKDIDGDRLPDDYETTMMHTDPLLADTDKDGFSDSVDAAPLDPAISQVTPGAKVPVLGSDTLQVYLDTDRSTSTGYRAAWMPLGADLMVQLKGKFGAVLESALYEFSGLSQYSENWTYRGQVISGADGKRVELAPTWALMGGISNPSMFFRSFSWNMANFDLGDYALSSEGTVFGSNAKDIVVLNPYMNSTWQQAGAMYSPQDLKDHLASPSFDTATFEEMKKQAMHWSISFKTTGAGELIIKGMDADLLLEGLSYYDPKDRVYYEIPYQVSGTTITVKWYYPMGRLDIIPLTEGTKVLNVTFGVSDYAYYQPGVRASSPTRVSYDPQTSTAWSEYAVSAATAMPKSGLGTGTSAKEVYLYSDLSHTGTRLNVTDNDVILPEDTGEKHLLSVTPSVQVTNTKITVGVPNDNRIDIKLENKTDGRWYHLTATLPAGNLAQRVFPMGQPSSSTERSAVVDPNTVIHWFQVGDEVHMFVDPINGYSIEYSPPRPSNSLLLELANAGANSHCGQMSAIVYPYSGGSPTTASDHAGRTEDNTLANEIDIDAGSKIALRFTGTSTQQYGNPATAGAGGGTGATGNLVQTTMQNTTMQTTSDGIIQSSMSTYMATPTGAQIPFNVTQKLILRDNARWFATIYYIRNTGTSTATGLKFFQGMDWNFAGSAANDNSQYNSANQTVYGYDTTAPAGNIQCGGFSSTEPTVQHDANTYTNIWTRIRSNGLLNGTTSTGDSAMALAWGKASLAPGQTWTIPIIWGLGFNVNDMYRIIEIGKSQIYDVAVKSIDTPANNTRFNALMTPTTSIKSTLADLGMVDAAPLTVYCNITGPSGYFKNVTMTTNLTLPFKETAQVSYDLNILGLATGTYKVTVKAVYPKDQKLANNTKTVWLNVTNFVFDPDNSSMVSPGTTKVYQVSLVNGGPVYSFDISISSSAWATELYNGSTLMARDLDHNGVWEWINPACNTNGNGYPDISAKGFRNLTVKKAVPKDALSGDTDTSVLTATSTTASSVKDSLTLTTIVQASQAKIKTLYLQPNSKMTTTNPPKSARFTTVAIYSLESFLQTPKFGLNFTISGWVNATLALDPANTNQEVEVSLLTTNGVSSISIGTVKRVMTSNALLNYTFTFPYFGVIPIGYSLNLVVRNIAATGLDVYHCMNNPSRIDILTSTYIQVTSIKVLNATTGIEMSSVVPGDKTIIQITVKDPFSQDDIVNGILNMTSPSGPANDILNKKQMNASYYIPQYFINLWELMPDWPNPVEWISGVNSTANTFGPGAGDDGWDWTVAPGTGSGTGPYGGQCDDITIGLNSADLGDNKYRIGIGRNQGNGNNNGPDSAAIGVQFKISNDMWNTIKTHPKVNFSFDWNFRNSGLDPTDAVWVKARFGNASAGMSYLGSNLDSNADATNEIWWTNDPSTSSPASGTAIYNVTSLIGGPGDYYIDMGAKVLSFGNNDNGYFYFDNVNLVIERPETYTRTFTYNYTFPATSMSGNYTINASVTELNGVTNFGLKLMKVQPGVDISPNNTASGAPGTNVTYAHTIKNTGNGNDVYDIKVTSSLGFNVSIYYDTNGNGVLDSGEPKMGTDTGGDGTWNYVNSLYDSNLNSIPDTGKIKPLATYKIIVEVQIPPGTGTSTDVTNVTVSSPKSSASDWATDSTGIPEFPGLLLPFTFLCATVIFLYLRRRKGEPCSTT